MINSSKPKPIWIAVSQKKTRSHPKSSQSLRQLENGWGWTLLQLGSVAKWTVGVHPPQIGLINGQVTIKYSSSAKSNQPSLSINLITILGLDIINQIVDEKRQIAWVEIASSVDWLMVITFIPVPAVREQWVTKRCWLDVCYLVIMHFGYFGSYCGPSRLIA